MIVHHLGKDESRGMRGHSSLKASLDTVIHVEPSGSNYKWSIEKLKEGEDQKIYGYEAPVVDLGVDAKGKSITTLVVNPTGMLSEEGQRKLKLVKNQKTIFQLVRDVLDQALLIEPVMRRSLNTSNKTGLLIKRTSVDTMVARS